MSPEIPNALALMEGKILFIFFQNKKIGITAGNSS
jgi:hypothetical protein